MSPSGAAVKQLPEKLNPARCRAFRHEVEKSVSAMLRPAIIFQLPASARLDAARLDFLIRCARVAAEHDAEVAIAAPNAQHQVVLEVTRLSSVLPTFVSVEEATAYLDKYRAPKVDAVGEDSRSSSSKSKLSRERNSQP